MVTTWRVSDAGSNWTLSNANVTQVQANPGSWQVIRSDTDQSAGKRYIEMVCAVAGGSITNFAIGMQDNNTPFNPNYVISAANGAGNIGGGNITIVDSSDALLAAQPNIGTILALAIDFDVGFCWVADSRIGSYWVNGGVGGDPAAGTNPIFSFTPNQSLAMIWYAFDGGTGDGAWDIAGDTGHFSGTKPAGFIGWNDISANVALSGTMMVMGTAMVGWTGGRTSIIGRATARAMARAQTKGAAPLIGKAFVETNAKTTFAPKASLAAKATVETAAKASVAGKTSLVAKVTVAAKAFTGQVFGKTALAAFSKVITSARAAISSAAPGMANLFASAAIITFGRAVPGGTVKLAGKGNLSTRATAAPSLAAKLSSTVKTMTAAKLSGAVGKTALAALARVSTAAIAVFSSSGQVSLSATATIRTFATAAIGAFVAVFSPVPKRTLSLRQPRVRTLSNMYVGKDFSNADVGEVITYFFDFTNDLATAETIQSSSWVASVAKDSEVSDPNAANIATGPASVTGNITGQRFAHMVAGVKYLVVASVVTNQGNTLELWSHFYCEVPK